MKKIFTPLLMLVALLCSTTALAASGLRICGIDVNTDPLTDGTEWRTITGPGISGYVVYNPTEKRLVLNEATLTSSGTADGIYNYGVDGLLIEIRYNSSITTNSEGSNTAAIYCDKRTVIKGWYGANSIFTLRNTGAGPAIKSRGAEIYIYKAKFTATAANNHAIVGQTYNGVKPVIRFDATQVNATAASGYYAVTGFTEEIDMKMTVLSNNATINATTGTIVNSSNEPMQSAEILPALIIGSSWISKNTRGSIDSTGQLYEYVDGLLRLDNVNLDGVTLISRLPDLTIRFVGNCSISSNDWTLDLYGNTTIIGDGIVNITSTARTAIYINDAYNLIIRAREFNALSTASNYSGIYGRSGSTLTLNKCSDDCIYRFAGGQANICIPKLVMNDMDISTEETYWNRSDGYTYYKGEIAKGTTLDWGTWFKPTNAIDYCNLWVAGTHVRQGSTSYITSPYMDKVALYYPSSKLLKLDGVTINMPGNSNPQTGAVIYSEIQDLNINATGTNNWESVRTALHLSGSGTASISGSGTLNITSQESAAINTTGSTSVLLARSGDVMAMKGKTYGFYGCSNSSLTINKSGNGTNYKFMGETANIANIPSLNLSDGVHIWSTNHWFNPDKSAIYYQENIATSTGLNNGTWIRSDVAWTEYPIQIAGTRLYGSTAEGMGNIRGFWNEYVKGGSISYSPAINTLTLKDAVIEADKYAIINDKEDLTIKLEGNNTISAQENCPYVIYLGAATTITGGTLTINQQGRGGYCFYVDDADLTFNQAQLSFSGNFGTGIYGNPDRILKFNYSDIEACSTNYGTIINWGSIILTGCDVIEPNPVQKTSFGIADENGDYRCKVVISSDPDAINTVSETEAAIEDIYDLSGCKLGQAGSGVNIIRRKDGSTTKILRQ